MDKRIVASAALVLLLTAPLFAHAVLLEAKPTANGSVAGPDVDVKLRFNSRIDPARSHLALVLPDQTVHTVSLEQSSNPAALDAHLKGLQDGLYKLRWQVLASDGHITRGEIPFQVK